MNDKPDNKKDDDKDEKYVAVAVIALEGTYPSSDEFRRAKATDKISEVLDLAKKKLEITNTDGWIVQVGNKDIDPNKTYKALKLDCIVEIEWHKHEGGGGASRVSKEKL